MIGELSAERPVAEVADVAGPTSRGPQALADRGSLTSAVRRVTLAPEARARWGAAWR
jgi:hypothetical protein